jgi:hypothetical protein
MKKTYINPTMTVVKLKQRSDLLLTGSAPKVGSNYSGRDVLSREFDDFEDFDD